MKRILLFLSTLLFIALQAQTDGLPANAEAGKCYVKCVTQNEFGTATEQVMVKPAYKVLEVIPATYKWVEEQVLIKEASKKMVYHPATFKTVDVPYVKKEQEKVLRVVPATFGSSSKTFEVYPKTSGWEYTTYSECTSPNPEDCQVLCFTEAPAKFKDVSLTTLASDASTTESTLPEKPASYTKQVIDRAAYVEEIDIPAKYSTIKRQVLDQPARTTERTVPAVYKTVEKTILTKAGGITTWEEIDCGLVQANDLDILWDLNSAKLRPDSKRKIDNVLLPLLREKNVNVELASHTDSRGSDDFNRALSQRRADAVKAYLVSKGIASNRLVSKGYGESRLKNNCGNGVRCSESQHQVNRRTEYKVLN